MTEIERIAALADDDIARFGTRDPFELAEEMGIQVIPCADFTALRGMYQIILDKPYIFLNGKMSRREARWTLAHELGHHALHREMAENSIVKDNFLIDMTLKPEYEANLYAAELLFDDRASLSLLRRGETLSRAAALLHGEEFLFRLKVLILRDRGKLPR